ncbi:hypothetical protein EG68_00111 [Paragonimus skrjabini miyazakii]|uniref:TRAF3-interacting protein 1 n=1 Tax=Paragonimus skrjabini miyazakii TaxID=59628 RepID=A0A8S9ZCK6_9TREM|nr:hypothetical protein EG68_00111 [Paragonimus skrjabini miyazakii]
MEVDPRIIKRTQETLGRIIKKPTLTDKLLSRPPFRFIHDICTAFIRSTGLMKGLFRPEELNADNVRDKDSKLAFLQKLVDYLSIAHGYIIPVRIMSVIAGKEPEKTNEMLFLLADIINKGVNNEDCIARTQRGDARQLGKKSAVKAPEQHVAPATDVLKKNSPAETGTTQSDSKNDNDGGKHKKIRRDKEKADETPKRHTSRSKIAESERENTPALEKKRTDEAHHQTGKRTLESTPEQKERSKLETGRQSAQSHEPTNQQQSRSSSSVGKSREEEGTPMSRGNLESPTITRISRPASAKGNRARKEIPVEPMIAATPIQEEPKADVTPNARLAPPRPRKIADLTIEDSTKINGTAGPGITGLIIPESHQDSDEDEDAQFVIEETVCSGTNLLTKLGEGDTDDQQEHGGLVTKMLQSKREFEAGNMTSQSKIDSQGNAADHLDEATRQRERANIEKEVERICQALQSLSRSALPLGKLMDFVQEDLESMQQEFERWTVENQALRAQIRQEESLTQTSLDPLRAQLNELKNYACEQRKAIATFKAKILTNDERIQDLLSNSLARAR